MNQFDELGLQFADIIGPWIAVLVSISAAFWFKDFATNLMAGLKFKFNPAFNEGDLIILDGQDAIIVRIGVRETVFGTFNAHGYTWRYISNERIKFHRLEKIINKHLHLDTEEERGKRLQELIDKGQDDKIASNKQAIDKIKNGG